MFDLLINLLTCFVRSSSQYSPSLGGAPLLTCSPSAFAPAAKLSSCLLATCFSSDSLKFKGRGLKHTVTIEVAKKG